MRKIYPEDLTVNQIRYLILEKRRAVRGVRLEQFQRTGRVIPYVGELVDCRNGTSFKRTKVKDDKVSQHPGLDRLLFGMEFLAIIGLISIVTIGLSALRTLNQTVAAALQQPTLEPTPMVREVVLPDGHTPPDSLGGARPNEGRRSRCICAPYGSPYRISPPRSRSSNKPSGFKFHPLAWTLLWCREMAGNNLRRV